MKKKNLFLLIIIFLLLFLLISPAQAIDASRAGLMLWFQSVLPVLLPFMILSRLLIRLDGLSWLTKLLYPVLHRFFGLSLHGIYGLLLGFLCGYPMGAKITGDLVRDGSISKEEGNYMLHFCNNVSPAFLLGFCMTEHLKAPNLIPLTLMLLYGMPLFLALFWRKGMAFSTPNKGRKTEEKQTSGFQISFKIVDACIMDGLESVFKLGCYIILFSILARLVSLLPWPHPFLTGISIGILEITNGIAAVCQLEIPFHFQYGALLAFASFGGLSGIAQTNSMLQGSGLSTGSYIGAKLITTTAILLLGLLVFILL